MGTSISSILQVTTAATGVAPGPATNLAVSNVTGSSLTLSWVAPTVGNKPDTYTPQYKLPSATVWIPFSATATTATTATVTGLLPGTAYNLSVVTSNGVAPQSTSAVITATTTAVTPPSPPVLGSSPTVGSSVVGLTWTPSAGTTTTTVALGPTATSSFVNVDFTNLTAFFGGITQTVSPYVWGFATGQLGDNSCADAANAGFVASCDKLKPTLLRFNANLGLVSGGSAASVQNFINNYKSCFSPNLRIVMGIGMTDTAAEITNFARAMISAGMPIQYWELGNESDGTVTTPNYITQFNSVAATLHSVDPAYKLGGPVWSWYNAGSGTNPLQTFAAGVGSNLGFCCWHNYATSVQGQAGAIDNGLTNTDVTAVRAALTAAGISPNVPLGLLEYNENVNGVTYGDITQSQPYGAVYAALMVYGGIKQDLNYQMSGLWDIDGDSWYGAINNQNTGFGNIDTQGWTLGFGGQNLYGTRVGPAAPVVNAAQNLVVLPVLNSTAMAVMIVNYSQTATYSGQVALSHWPINTTGTGTITKTVTTTNPPTTSTLLVTAGIVASDTFPPLSVTFYTAPLGTTTTTTTSSATYGVDYRTSAIAGTGGGNTTYFTVSNGKILTPSGATFTPRGIALGYVDLPFFVTNSQAQPLTTLFPGLNIVRLAIDDTQGDHTQATSYNGGSVANIKSYVDILTANKIVVAINDHTTSDHTNNGGGAGTNYTAANGLLAPMLAYYTSWATAYLGNPYLWFGSRNEPPNDSQGALTIEQVALYNAIRGTGNNTIIEIEQVSGGTPSGFGITPVTEGANNTLGLWPNSAYATMSNIIWGPHNYNWLTGYSTDPTANANAVAAHISQCQQIQSADGLVPVAIWEYGIGTGISADAGGYALATATQNALATGGGSIAWCADQYQGANSLTNLPGSSGRTAWGNEVAGFFAANASTAAGVGGGGGGSAGVAAGPWVVATTGLTGLSYTVSGLASVTSYDFEIIASNAAGSATSNVVTAVTTAGGGLPSAPQNLVLSSNTSSTLTVTWTAPAGGSTPTGYTVSYVISPYTSAPATVTLGNVLTATITGLQSGTSYQLFVVATNASGTGASSANLIAQTATSGGTGTRNPFLQPGGNAGVSPWNTPIGTVAVFSGAADADTASLIGKINTVNGGSYGQNIYVATASDPKVTFTSASAAGSQRCTYMSIGILGWHVKRDCAFCAVVCIS